MKSELESRVFHTLDALRGTAAIGVVMFHIGAAFWPLAAPGGYLAVDLFFMMSGVVLSHAYEPRFRSGMSTIGFMRARLIRLYPLYLLGLLLGIAVTVASLLGRNSVHWDVASLTQAALLSLFFLPNFSAAPVDQIFPLNIPCWSLFFELFVNLLFVLAWPWLSTRRLILTVLVTAAVIVWAVVNVGHLDQGSSVATFGVGLARTLFGFCVGVLIARHLPRAQRTDSNLGVLAIVALLGLVIFAAPHGSWRQVWDAGCVLLVFPAMVCAATFVDPGPRAQRVATFLGLTSYAVYVLHSPLSSVMNTVSRHFAGNSPDAAHFGAPYVGFAVLVVLLIGCWVVDRYFDTPIRNWLSRRLPRQRH